MNYEDILENESNFNKFAKLTFEKCDKDSSGIIDLSEFEITFGEVTKSLGFPKPSHKDIQNVFKSLDSDKSGNISFEEFKIFVRKILEIQSNRENSEDED